MVDTEEVIEGMKINAQEVLGSFGDDKPIESESAKLAYLNLVTENLRSNNKKIVRNSFWLVLSFLLYILIFIDDSPIKNVKILFVTIEDNILLLNLIPVFFSFLFFQNITLWNNNINLHSIFEDLSKDLFELGTMSDSKNIIRPFLLTSHVINYQFNNEKINNILKMPSTIMMIIIMYFPLLLVVASVIIIAMMNTCSLIPVLCGVLTSMIAISTLLQALSTYKN